MDKYKRIHTTHIEKNIQNANINLFYNVFCIFIDYIKLFIHS